MYIAVHAAAGAAVSTLVPNPFLSVPLSFGGHFVLDAIPHWQSIMKGEEPTKNTIKISSADFVVSVIISNVFILTTANLSLLWGIISASIIDTDVVWFLFSTRKRWRRIWPKFISDIHGRIQNETRSYWGLFTQIVTALLSLVVIYN